MEQEQRTLNDQDDAEVEALELVLFQVPECYVYLVYIPQFSNIHCSIPFRFVILIMYNSVKLVECIGIFYFLVDLRSGMIDE